MNNNIFPCLWFNENGGDAANFYAETFGGKILDHSKLVINLELFGQKIMILNAGPQFEKNASISFMIVCKNEEEVEKYWKQLSKGGIILMELGEYSWSKKYGWVRDQFGVTWQVSMGENLGDQKIIPNLMFIHENNGKALEAINLYTQIFPNAKTGSILKYGEGNESHEISDNIQHADFEIDGFTFFCIDNSYDHQFDFSEGISMVVMTESQEQTDHLWNSLTANGGKESMCGWLKDQFGMSWQIIPKKLTELMSSTEHSRNIKTMGALMGMKKIMIAELEKAHNS